MPRFVDVDDIESFTGRIVRFSGLELSYHEREELHTFLIETAWLLGTRYRPGEGVKFSTWAGRTLKLRCVDWVRSHRGRTKWSFAAGSYERPRAKLVSLDGVGGSDGGLGETLPSIDGDPASGRDPDLRGLLDAGDRTRSEDLAALGL